MKKSGKKGSSGGGQRAGVDTGGQNSSDCPLERLTVSLKGQQGLGCSICKVRRPCNHFFKTIFVDRVNEGPLSVLGFLLYVQYWQDAGNHTRDCATEARGAILSFFSNFLLILI